MEHRYSLPRTAVCLGWLFLLLYAGEAPARVLEVPAGAFEAPAGADWFEVFVDRTGSVAAGQRPAPEAFAPASAAGVNVGLTDAAVWARFTLRFAPERQRPVTLVLPKPLIDHVEMRALSAGRTLQHVVTGDAAAFASRPYGYRGFAFDLDPVPGSEVTYYLRAHSPTGAVDLPLSLLDTRVFRHRLALENVLLGAFFGAMAALALGAALLFARLRQRVFGYYALYTGVSTLVLVAISGYGMLLLWPANPAAQQYLPTILASLAVAAGVLFFDRFLALERWPRLRHALIAALAAAVGGALVHALGTGRAGSMMVLGAVAALCPLVVFACRAAIHAGAHHARHVLWGWLLYAAGLLAAALSMFGLVPHSPLTAYALYAGMLAQFVALTVAVGERLLHAHRERETEVARTAAELAALNLNLESMVRHRTRELEARNSELAELAIRDGLTGLYNHSATIELLEQILSQSQRYGFPLTVIMIDIDHFKYVNDTWGHQVGDSLLERVARTLVEALRESDVVGRYGGEEFLVVMPHADAHAAREFGERLLARIREIEVPRSEGAFLSVSLGIAVVHPHGQRCTAADLVSRADAALYRSKREGRDRLTVDSLSLVASAAGQPRIGRS